jgi:hypothetical protein
VTRWPLRAPADAVTVSSFDAGCDFRYSLVRPSSIPSTLAALPWFTIRNSKTSAYTFEAAWSSEEAAICTQGGGAPLVPQGRPTGSPWASVPSGSAGPANSNSASAAPSGDFPQPLDC